MTDRPVAIDPLEGKARGHLEVPADAAADSGDPIAIDHRNMSKRFGERLRRPSKARSLKLICVLLLLGGGALDAQDGAPLTASRDSSATPDRAEPAAASTPRALEQSQVGSGRLGITLPVSDAARSREPLAAYPAASLRQRGPGVALMIVGAAAIVTGLLIDESLITILGAGTGLVGLYLYLR